MNVSGVNAPDRNAAANGGWPGYGDRGIEGTRLHQQPVTGRHESWRRRLCADVRRSKGEGSS